MQRHITDDVRVLETRPLISPEIIMGEVPGSASDYEFVARARREADAILKGHDDRLLVIAGPCSIHDEKSALEYAGLLKDEAKKYDKDLQIVMRVYFEKPRTTVGWKGYINDPGLDETYDINKGLLLARQLLAKIAELRVAAGTEFLDVISPQYVADLVTWGAIGARTVESQLHRELASGLSMPVGFKNGTGGGLGIALDAIQAAAGRHCFLSVTKQGVAAIVSTSGNDACHVILRGGKAGANYSADKIAEVREMLATAQLSTGIMVDCSHGNSNKDHRNQPMVARDLASQIRAGDTAIRGVMIESHLVEGKQEAKRPAELLYGQSITDACLGWEPTKEVFATLADAVRDRRCARG